MSVWLERNSKITTALFVLAFFVIADFIAGRIFIAPPHQIPNPYYHHDIRQKNFKGRLVWQNEHYAIYTNSLGFKDKSNRKVDLVTNKYRIVFMGDSSTEGVGYPYEKTFVGIIDEAMRGRRDIEVLNAATGGFSPKLYYLKLKYFIDDVGLRFNELFVYLSPSDITEEIYYRDYAPFDCAIQKRLLLSAHRCLLRNSLSCHFLYYYVLPKANVAQVIRRFAGVPGFSLYRYFPEGSLRPCRDASGKKEGLLLAKKNLDNLRDLCDKNKIKMTLAIYPTPQYIVDESLKSEWISFWRDYCKNNRIDFLDCFPAFISGSNPGTVVKEYFLENDSHFNLNGHILMAQKWLDMFAGQKPRSEGRGSGAGMSQL